MQNKQRYITAGVTLTAALAAAHVMQSNENAGVNTASVVPIAAAVASTPNAEAVASDPVENEVIVVANVSPDLSDSTMSDGPEDVPAQSKPMDTLLVDDVSGAPIPSSDTFVASDFPNPPSDVLMPDPLPSVGPALRDRMAVVASLVETPVIEETERNKFGLTCGPILSASTKSDTGMVKLTLTAPCRGEQRLEMTHGPLQFSLQTDPLGNLQINVPAMTADAIFKATFLDGESASTSLEVPAAKSIERVAVVADGHSGLQIHALEFGADYGEKGHIWAETPGDMIMAGLDGGGYLVRLGDMSLENSIVSEVYTYPGRETDQSGVVRLSVEAEVTAMNCATEIAGQSIEPTADGTPLSMSMTVAIPDCDAIGEYLVLKNVLRDLRIASN